MFFYLSKTLQYICTPLTWIVAFLIIALIVKREKLKKFFLVSGVVLLVLFTNPMIVNLCMGAWEYENIDKKSLSPCYDYGIVLTGMTFYDASTGKVDYVGSCDRIMETIQLYNEGIIKKIFISGGSGLVFDQEHKESQLLKDYLVSIKIPEEDIIIETESKNTHENAVEAAKMLKPSETVETYLLITSSLHMRRSEKCFANEGFVFDVYPVDKNSKPLSWNLDSWLIPLPSALSSWGALLHELIGYLMYDWVGYF